MSRARRSRVGFEVIETGPFGYFPTDPKELQKWCDEFGMRVVAGTDWGILHKQDAWETTLRTFRAIAETHAAVGAEYIVHLPPLYRDDKTWEWTDERVLGDDAWKLYVEMSCKGRQLAIITKVKRNEINRLFLLLIF